MSRERPIDCPECGGEDVSRRQFVRALGGVALAGALAPAAGRIVLADDPPKAAAKAIDAESAARRLYESLNKMQKETICLPYDHASRKKISANWAITKFKLDDDFTKEQQALADEIFKGVTSPDGYERFQKQMDEDYGGFGQYHIAFFGEPGSGKFEFELTGRHLTIRADGDSAEGAAFGGPIIYGHGAGDSEKGLPGNVFYYQTKKANEVFQALDGAQRKLGLVSKAPAEDHIGLQGSSGKFPGISVAQLSTDQKALVESVVRVGLAPYREKDIDEAMAVMKSGGGLDALHMAFYESEDIGGDHEWDIWRLEGPTFVWHFRGAPHVHAYLNVGKKA